MGCGWGVDVTWELKDEIVAQVTLEQLDRKPGIDRIIAVVS
jgi:hypothetical protein